MLSFVRNAVILFGSMGVARAVTLPIGEQAPPAPLLEDHGAQERFVGFQTCSPSIGLVHSVVVRDHDAGSASLESSSDTSIVFRSGRLVNYKLKFLLLLLLF